MPPQYEQVGQGYSANGDAESLSTSHSPFRPNPLQSLASAAHSAAQLDLTTSSELTTKQRKDRWIRNSLINLIFIALWFSFATFLSLYNKWMFSKDKYAFPNPLFVTTMHVLMQFLLSGLLRRIRPDEFSSPNRPTKNEYVKSVAPCGVTTGLDIGLSNLSLKTITLSFYTMCKNSSLIFVLIFAFLFKLEPFSWRIILVIFIVFSGVMLMVASETQFVLGGMLLVLGGSAFGGLRWALVELLMKGKGKEMGVDNPASTVFWLAPASGLSLLLLSFIIESWSQMAPFFDSFGGSLKTIGLILFPGTLAFIMIMSEFYIIKRVGIVPMSITGIFKEVCTISLGALVFGDEVTPVNWIGVGITIIGIGVFTYHRYQKSVHMAASSKPEDENDVPLLNSTHTNDTPMSARRLSSDDGSQVFVLDDEDDNRRRRSSEDTRPLSPPPSPPHHEKTIGTR